MSSQAVTTVPSFRIRPYEPADREFVLGLAPRLVLGTPPWRTPEAMLATMHRFIVGSIDAIGRDAAVFVAEDDAGARLGFATVAASKHFSLGSR